jgi:hypothetical protein
MRLSHTNLAPRWLDPQQHDRGATPGNFLNGVHDALIAEWQPDTEQTLSGLSHLGIKLRRLQSDALR